MLNPSVTFWLTFLWWLSQHQNPLPLVSPLKYRESAHEKVLGEDWVISNKRPRKVWSFPRRSAEMKTHVKVLGNLTELQGVVWPTWGLGGHRPSLSSTPAEPHRASESCWLWPCLDWLLILIHSFTNFPSTHASFSWFLQGRVWKIKKVENSSLVSLCNKDYCRQIHGV